MKARSSRASSIMRVLSPRMDPPERVLDGSTASTASRSPVVEDELPERLDERALADTRGTRDADPHDVGGGRGQRFQQDARPPRDGPRGSTRPG